ncbi:anthranilate synthase component II [Saccharospirillum salsuginis]|uniref:Anthranilate synthase component 2 n=1 Tax=Saccharospirillum salsuginis TaxID=418750 RepID=A0A918K2I6_9GAMM|nr:aminodeoxychorismate/anthranilate synthase component II [Saccharospirillum salsuginis]GGX43890.1 anthranilate synthase component 2 [Saccharospirillum salsuginis]
MTVVMIDNHDSFTYNLVHYLGELGADVAVVQSDAVTLADLDALAPAGVMISPGPCTPFEAGISMDAIRHFAGRVPVLGVCLGHQCIGQVYGAEVTRAGQVMHGKTSRVHHRDRGVFSGLPNPFTVTRYHSLVVRPDSLPETLDMTAWTQRQDGSLEEIMGLRHRDLDIEGVQFHPESILTEQGHALLQRYLNRLDRQSEPEPAPSI